jgi:hypothetical protein
MDLFGLDNAYYWGMAVGSPFSLLALLFHPFIIDYVKNVYVRIFWTLGVSFFHSYYISVPCKLDL